MQIKYGKMAQSTTNVEMKNLQQAQTPSKSSGSQPMESSSTSHEHENRMSKYATIMDLPRVLYDHLVSYWDANDFGTLAELAESDRSLSMATFARGWLTVQ